MLEVLEKNSGKDVTKNRNIVAAAIVKNTDAAKYIDRELRDKPGYENVLLNYIRWVSDNDTKKIRDLEDILTSTPLTTKEAMTRNVGQLLSPSIVSP